MPILRRIRARASPLHQQKVEVAQRSHHAAQGESEEVIVMKHYYPSQLRYLSALTIHMLRWELPCRYERVCRHELDAEQLKLI